MLHHKKYRKPSEKKPAMKRRRRWCGKVCYSSRYEADNAIAALTRSRRLDPNKIGAFEGYYCKRCKAYHAGHDKNKVVA